MRLPAKQCSCLSCTSTLYRHRRTHSRCGHGLAAPWSCDDEIKFETMDPAYTNAGTPASPVRCQHTLTYQKISSRMDIKTCCLIWISFTDLSSFARAVSVFDHPSRAKVPDLQHITAERHLSHGYWRDTRCRRTGPDYCILNNIRFQVVRICIAQNPNLFHVNKFAFSSHRSCCSPLRLNPGNCLLAGWLVEVIACSLVPSY